MCGIAGALFGRISLEDLEDVGRRMTSALAHRGPDAAGVHVVRGAPGVLAHTRLRIIDLSEAGSQPFVSSDGRLALVFNGEIYNYRELRQRLVGFGTTFRSASDTEVILEQYRSRGMEGLFELDGMFAFALWDEKEKALILGRDRLGKKPLYLARAPDGALVFASEPKALFAYPGVEARIDPERLPSLLAYGYVPTPGSLYRGVSKVEPATMTRIVSGREPESVRYWSLEARAREPLRIDAGEAKVRVRSALRAAVRKRLISDVPLGAFLSGGVDSSVVVAEMAEVSTPRTFAVGFDGDASFDERIFAKQVADQFGAVHTEIVVSASPSDLLERLLFHHDEPYGDSSALALFAVSRATREHVTVALTGDGGDEVFGGYTRFLGGLFVDRVPRAASRALAAILKRLPEPRGYKHPLALLRRLVEHSDRAGMEQLLAWNAFFAGPSLQAIVRSDVLSTGGWTVFADQLEIFERARSLGFDRLNQILLHNAATYLLDDLLVKADRMTMAVGLEARSPFLDTELVELAFRLPSALKIRRGRLKWLLKEAYRDVLPSAILDRKKHGFGVPLSAWWNGKCRAIVDDLLVAEGSEYSAFLEQVEVRRIVAEHRDGRRDHGQRIFLLLQLELWLRSLRRAPARAQVEPARSHAGTGQTPPPT